MEDLAEKLILQERRIGELERKCNISNDFLSEEYTNKSASAENLENYYSVWCQKGGFQDINIIM